MATFKYKNIKKLKYLYYEKRYNMRQIGEYFRVSTDAVYYFMRHNNIKRRTHAEERKLRFENKEATFEIRRKNSKTKELEVIGAMLYWGEGYKGDEMNPSKLVDFANSDPEMISLFLKFLRGVYSIQESKLRIFMYCYSDQNVEELISFWSKITSIPKQQFSKPYVRKDFKVTGRKMRYGLVHIRYHDKKLLLEIKKLIDSYKLKYLRRW